MEWFPDEQRGAAARKDVYLLDASTCWGIPEVPGKDLRSVCLLACHHACMQIGAQVCSLSL